jgi:archaellum component FlaC
MARNDPPISQIMNLKKQGLSGNAIKKYLEQQGYSEQIISEALSQVDIKEGVTPSGMTMQTSMMDTEDIPVPTPAAEEPEEVSMPEQRMPRQSMASQQVTAPQPSSNVEQIHELIESVIDERWQQVVSNIGDISIWRAKINDDIMSIKQEILRVEDRFENLQKAVLGKVTEYGQSMIDVNSELKALEDVFGKIIEPLSTNIKELSRITNDLKGTTAKGKVGTGFREPSFIKKH